MDPMVDWNERAISQKAWQLRQQNGEYDTSSVSSSLAKKGTKNVGPSAQQQQEGILVPYGENGFSRRAGSSAGEFHEPMMHRRFPPGPGPPFYGPIPPPAFFPPTAPPNFLRPPPPHHLFGHPPPPHLFPPRMIPFPPPAPHFGEIFHLHFPNYSMPSSGRIAPFPPFAGRPPFFFMPPPPPFFGTAKGHPKSAERGSGPIITESVYDTFPRNRATYEEPIVGAQLL